MNAERCSCPMREGMTFDELKGVKSCQKRWICGELVKARKAAERREASSRRIAKLTASFA